MIQSDALFLRPDLCPDDDNNNKDIVMLPQDMFLNLIDTELQNRIALSDDLDGMGGSYQLYQSILVIGCGKLDFLARAD